MVEHFKSNGYDTEDAEDERNEYGASVATVRLLARAEAWWRRRHLLLAVRGRAA